MSRADSMTELQRAQAGVWCARLADGDLSRDESEAFDAWLTTPAHREALDDALMVWHSVESMQVEPDMIVMRGQALEAARRGDHRRHALRWIASHRTWISLAACVLVAVVAAGAWLRYVPHSYVTGVGERRVVALADGSRMSLDAATEVRVLYTGDRRNFWLKRGRAKFAVAKDPLRPFVVVATNKVVVATGTEFSVELLRGQVHVVLYEGRVSVLQVRNEGGESLPVPLAQPANERGPSLAPIAADEVLKPGREMIMPLAVASAAAVTPIDPVRSLSWEAGQLIFDDEPLASAVERVNRYSDRRLTVGDAADVRVSGVFTTGDVEAFLVGVTEVFPVRAVSAPDGGVTFRKRNPAG